MGSSAVQIGCVAFGVLALVLITVCCAVPGWIVLFMKVPNVGPMQMNIGLWKTCVGLETGPQICTEYTSLPGSPSALPAVRAMTVISCLLTYLGFLVLILMGFCANCITFLQNEDTKPKIRLGVGVGLLLAGILVIISVIWFPHSIEQKSNNQINMALPPPQSDVPEPVNGACIYVGGVAGAVLILGGGLLCCFRKRDIP